MIRLALLFLGILLLPVAAVSAPSAAAPPADGQWVQPGPNGEPVLQLYFFWAKTCPHCQDARPVVTRLAAERPWLRLHSLELTESAENRHRYFTMAAALGQEARSVPAFLYCDNMRVGFATAQTTGSELIGELEHCYRRVEAGLAPRLEPGDDGAELLDSVGIERSDLSLPALTVIIAGLDAFNPCAFFVLLFLLSLLVHVGSRRRMLLIGGVFVAISGLVYFGLMAAWLNVFLLAGELRWVTAVAGALAVVMAALNLKDFALPGRGPSLSIADSAKPGLYQRVRRVLQGENLPAMLASTILLAIAANSYELLCTAGFPMVYTRVLTLEGLSTAGYYLYLLLYNVIYILPLSIIVLLFTYTLGGRKLQAREGRLLKLLSGTMMALLGALLLIAPEQLGNIATAAGLLGVAIIVTAFGAWWLYRGARR